MSECVVVAVIRPKAGEFETVKAILSEVAAEVHAEEGCELYALHESVSGELVLVEKWTNRQLWQAHMDGPLVEAIGQRAGHLFATPPEIYELSAVAAGTAPQATL